MRNIFLIAGRTGGPFFPLPAVSKNLEKYNPVFIGIRGGFEEKVCKENGWRLEYLPDARFTLFSFSKVKPVEALKNYLDLANNVFVLNWSFIRSIFLLVKYKPKMVYSTGSFLAVPIIYASKLTNFLRFTKAKIVIHQQDPLPGLSNKLTIKFADYSTCVFDYTKSKFIQFRDSQILPNPIDVSKYSSLSLNSLNSNSDLKEFISAKSNKLLLLVFGGGSGSEDINKWVSENLESLLERFRVLHLTGILQKKSFAKIEHEDYFSIPALFKEMPVAIKFSDLVLCRAGLASITELSYLQKPAYLVPLPGSHQEKNAEMVRDKFYTLEQKEKDSWLKIIDISYPAFFKSVKYDEVSEVESRLNQYYQKLRSILDNS